MSLVWLIRHPRSEVKVPLSVTTFREEDGVTRKEIPAGIFATDSRSIPHDSDEMSWCVRRFADIIVG